MDPQHLLEVELEKALAELASLIKNTAAQDNPAARTMLAQAIARRLVSDVHPRLWLDLGGQSNLFIAPPMNQTTLVEG